MTTHYFRSPMGSEAQYRIYQMPQSAKVARDMYFVSEKTRVYPEDYVCVARGEFNKDAKAPYILDELFEIYNHQQEELEYTVLKHYGSESMSSGNVIELRYPDGRILSYLCCAFGWHLLREDYFMK